MLSKGLDWEHDIMTTLPWIMSIPLSLFCWCLQNVAGGIMWLQDPYSNARKMESNDLTTLRLIPGLTNVAGFDSFCGNALLDHLATFAKNASASGGSRQWLWLLSESFRSPSDHIEINNPNAGDGSKPSKWLQFAREHDPWKCARPSGQSSSSLHLEWRTLESRWS